MSDPLVRHGELDFQARPPLPPFDHHGAVRKVRIAEEAWNSRDPERVARGYSGGSQWRNRSQFITGRAEIIAFLQRKWGTRDRIPADQGIVGLSGKPHRGALRL